ncbi:MAG: apolipoprotein N-acyltransferase, partial [Planctomycetes bacterium]|nr:apolipoprotein N-acyltransferase [Planctomycetota bacterium]
NKSYMDICREFTRPKIFDEMIREHTKDNGYVLVGAHTAEFVPKDDDYELTDRYNSAFLYRPDGLQDEKRYDKIHLVPFGEYIPFKNSAPFIFELFMKLSPYDYDYNLTHGREYTAFEVRDGEKVWHFGVLICYEDTDAEVTRKMVVDSDGRKKIDWITNISNDGWYTKYTDEGSFPSGELSQRLAITVFRAIENRISVVRSVNAGISCIIDTTGAIRDGFTAGSLPDAAMDRQAVSGWFVDRILTDGRITFFSQHGKWVDTICAVEIIVVLILAGIGGVRRRKSKG